MKMFASDNNSGVHPEIIKYLEMESSRYDFPYGADETTEKAKRIIMDLLGKEADIHFVTTGTAANIIGLSGMLLPFEAAVTAETTHINVDECNSLERFNGSKILTINSEHGKIKPEDVMEVMGNVGDKHASQPKIICISNLTEVGTIYSPEEIKALADFAHANDMYLHVDGARIANALEATGSTLKEMIGDTGVDLFSFGGTKNGMMMGEAIVCLNPNFKRNHKYSAKQGMQLVSKMRFVSVQYIPYLQNNLWLENAKNANDAGRYLNEKLEGIDGIEVVDYSNANILFVKMPFETIEKLEKELYFYVIDEKEGIIRLITSFDMTKEDVDELVELINKCNK